jgi:hypothetical protein
MAPKAAQEAAKKKAAKQKKILIGLGLVLVLALGYAVMTLTHLNSKPPVQATPAAATTPAGAIPTVAPAAAVTPGIAPPPVDSLRTFIALGRKDPFHDDGPNVGSPSKSTKSATSNGSSSKSKKTSGPPRAAVISLDGKRLVAAVHAGFGHAPGSFGPLFRLVKVTAKTAVIAVVGTPQRFTLHMRQPLTLAQAGGQKYTLILERIRSAAMAVQQTARKQ